MVAQFLANIVHIGSFLSSLFLESKDIPAPMIMTPEDVAAMHNKAALLLTLTKPIFSRLSFYISRTFP